MSCEEKRFKNTTYQILLNNKVITMTTNGPFYLADIFPKGFWINKIKMAKNNKAVNE